MSNKNEQIAAQVLEAIGGKDNISYVTHCITRLRFTLKDKSIPDNDYISNIPGVIGVNVAGSQYQVIIGQNVGDVYSYLCKIAGIEKQDAIDENLDEPKEKITFKNLGSKILDYISGSMTPLLSIMTGAALFKTLQTLLGPDMLHVIGESSDFYMLCGYVYSAFFYFLPILLGYTAAKRVKLNPVMGALAGACLLVPDFVTLASTADASFSVYGIPVKLVTYGQTVLPILLIVPVMNIVYKFFNKIIPELFRTLLVAFLTLLVMLPLIYCVLGPLGSYVGDLIANGLFAFGENGGFIAVAIIAALWEFIVMTGMHQALMPIVIATFMANGVDRGVLVAGGIATFACYGMALGAFLRIKNKQEKSSAFGYFVSGILGGVTEPTIYGIGIKYKRPFIALIVGSFIGGIYAGIMQVGQYVMVSASNFISVLGFVGGNGSNFTNALISCGIAFVITTIMTYLFGFKKDDPAMLG